MIPSLKTSDGSYVFTDFGKASTLVDYFCSVSSIDDSNTNLPYFENRTNSQKDTITILDTFFPFFG